MSQLSNFDIWRVNEVRRKRKCTIVDFTPLRESELYVDLISLGWEEVNAQGFKRIDPALELGRTDLTYQVQYQGEKQGNLRFKHEKFPERIIRMNLNGAIWEDAPSGRAYRINIEWDHDPKWFKACLNIDDYRNRLEYLIKKLLFQDGFITRTELLNTEGGVEIIKRKLSENADNIKKLRTVPPSLQKDQGYLKSLEDFGIL